MSVVVVVSVANDAIPFVAHMFFSIVALTLSFDLVANLPALTAPCAELLQVPLSTMQAAFSLKPTHRSLSDRSVAPTGMHFVNVSGISAVSDRSSSVGDLLTGGALRHGPSANSVDDYRRRRRLEYGKYKTAHMDVEKNRRCAESSAPGALALFGYDIDHENRT
jgi:hypothetical protein